MTIFTVCKAGNTTYEIGDAFVKGDCSEICECFSYYYCGDNDGCDEDDDDGDYGCEYKYFIDDYDDEDVDGDEDVRRRIIEYYAYRRNRIKCCPLCATGLSCPVGLVNDTNCFCNRSRCDNSK